jgi:hypothetical protein
MRSVAASLIAISSLSCGALAQISSAQVLSDRVSNNRPTIAAESLRGFSNMNDPGNGGAPLSPPAPLSVGGDPKTGQALIELCIRLKEAGAAAGFCK